jgi:uncharacterized protein YehS (DUF1456 family)
MLFSKLRKATINFFMYVCTSVSASECVCSARVVQLGFHRTDFYKILYLSIFQKSAEKIQASLKSDKNDGYYACRSIIIFYHVSLSSS